MPFSKNICKFGKNIELQLRLFFLYLSLAANAQFILKDFAVRTRRINIFTISKSVVFSADDQF